MDFELSDVQEEFRRVMRDFADKAIRPVAHEMERSGLYPDGIVEQMKEVWEEEFA